MRWMFADPQCAREAAYREITIKRIDQWWREFERKESELRSLFQGKSNWDLPAWMKHHLQIIDRNLMWEFGPAVSGNGHRLVITPEVRHDLRPLARSILKRAPKISGWEFYGARLAEDLEQAMLAVDGHTNVKLTGGQVQLRVGDHHRIDLNYTLDGTSPAKTENRGAAFVLTETLLGEEVLNKWIGEINGASSRGGFFGFGKKKVSADSVSLEGLQATVQSLTASVRDQLSSQPFLTRDLNNSECVLYQSTPPEAVNGDFTRQSDVVIGQTIDIEIIAAANSDPLFCSDRFSRCGEKFAYLKFDLESTPTEHRLDFRSAIEDSVNSALQPPRLGCAIGSATGVRYGYVNLALKDVTESIKAIRRALGSKGISKRSWIQFFDADWAQEWVGVFNDTPEPPLPPIED